MISPALPSLLLFLLLPLGLSVAGSAAERDVLLIDDFQNGLRPEWEEQRFRNRNPTRYVVVPNESPEAGGMVLRAESRGSASGLVFRVEFDPEEYPILEWRWKVENILKKGDARTKKGDDYPARIYVIFPHWFRPSTRTINYIWANRLPKGEHLHNSYYSKAIMIAVQSGSERVGQWITQRRNIMEDYRMVFGEDPPRAGAIALMTDTDDTGESAVAYYDFIRLLPER